MGGYSYRLLPVVRGIGARPAAVRLAFNGMGVR